MATERAISLFFTIDGSADLGDQIGASNMQRLFDVVETTSFADQGIKSREITLGDITLSVDLTAPEVDESVATSILSIIDAGAPVPFGSGDGKYAIVIQKVSAGGVPGTPTTKDPTYSFSAVVDGAVPVIVGDPSTLVNHGASIQFNIAKGSTYARATS